LSLDKWIKSDKEKSNQKSGKQNSQPKKKKNSNKSLKKIEPEKRLLKKFYLNCSNKSCNYQKVVMKRELNEKDLFCPRCEGKMKVKEN